MLEKYAGWEAAFVLDSMDDTENHKREIGAIIAKNIMKATGVTADKLKSYLGWKNYHSLTTLLNDDFATAQDILKDISAKT